MPSNEAPISINLKTVGGTQITLRAETADEFTQLTSSIFQIVEAVGEVETAVRGSAPAPVAAPVSSAPFGNQSFNDATPPNPQIAAITATLGGSVVTGTRMCPHGTMTRIHGLTGKFGPYKGHFCPAAQGDVTKCTTQYIKPNQPEYHTFAPDQTKQ